MKLTRTKLKQLIEEEIKSTMTEIKPMARVTATHDLPTRPEDTDINNKFVTAIDLLKRTGDPKFEETLELVRQAQVAYQQALRSA
tara:strand:- start:390 stop:644 length:255 start_codon:yes stop_codon:yes gene_type:complete